MVDSDNGRPADETTANETPSIDQSFLDFKWDESKEWESYLKNLYPIPDGLKLLKFRKKWFKNNVNEEFDINTDLGEDEFKKKEQETRPPQAAAAPPPPPSRPNPPPTSTTRTEGDSTGNGGAYSSRILWNSVCSVLLCLALVLHLASILPLGALAARSRVASIFCYLLGFAGSVFAAHGLPRWDANWWQIVMYHEGLQNFLMTMSALPIRVWIIMVSPFITALCILSTALPRSLASVPPLNRALTVIQANKPSLTRARSEIEVYSGLFFILAGLMGRINFLSCFMYWNTLRMKYSINPETKRAFSQLHNRILSLLSRPVVPTMVLTIYSKLAAAMHRYGEAGQQ